MALVGVFIDVFVMRIEGVVIEVEIGVGIGGALPGFGNGEVFGVEHLGFGGLASMAAPGWRGNRHGPVVAVVADRADEFLDGHHFHHAAQIGQEPIFAGDGARIALQFVLVVVHEHNAVGIGGDLL